MADKVRYVLDRMAVLFQQLKHYGVFTAEEVKSIIQKRTDFEYMILRPELTVSEYETYLNYELQLDQLRELRTKKLLSDESKSKEEINHLRIIRSSFIQHINYIYQRALRRFPKELHLWNSQVSFLQTKQSFQLLNIALGRAIALFPKNISFWLKAAVLEIEEKRNFHAARLLIQRAIRVNARNPQLWLKAFEIEILQVIDVFEKRREKLGSQYLENQPKDQESWKEDLLKPLSVVFRHACSSLLSTSSSSSHSDTERMKSDNNESDEDDEEEEEVGEAMVEVQQTVSTKDCLDAVCTMHYLALDIASSYDQWPLVEEITLYVERNFGVLGEIWPHLLKFEMIRVLTIQLLPLFSSNSVSKASTKMVEEQGILTILSLLPSGLSVLEKYEQTTSSDHSVREGLKSILITFVFSCLFHHQRMTSALPLSSEDAINSFQSEWKEVLNSLQHWQVDQFLETLPSCRFSEVQSHLSSALKTTKKASLQPVIDALISLQEAETVSPVTQDLLENLTVDSLTSIQRLISRSHCVAFLQVLKESLPASSNKMITIDESFIINQLYQWIQSLAKVVNRVEKGLSLDWRKTLEDSEVFASLWKEFSVLLMTLSGYQGFHLSRSWEEYLVKVRDSLLSLSVLFARWEESFPILKLAVSVWYPSESSSALFTVGKKSLSEEDEEDEEVRNQEDCLSWKEEMFRRVLLNSHFTTTKTREKILQLSLSSFFEEELSTASPDGDDVKVKILERYFQRYTRYFDAYPQFFSLELIRWFIQSFLDQLFVWMDSNDFQDDVVSRKREKTTHKRKLESEMFTIEVLLQRILQKSSQYWKRMEGKAVFPYESELVKVSQTLAKRQNHKNNNNNHKKKKFHVC